MLFILQKSVFLPRILQVLLFFLIEIIDTFWSPCMMRESLSLEITLNGASPILAYSTNYIHYAGIFLPLYLIKYTSCVIRPWTL